MTFKNPVNGYTEEANLPWLWTLFFGCFYFAVKGVWRHFVIGLLAAIFTAGISWLIYPFLAGSIIRTSYLRRGWVEVTKDEEPPQEIHATAAPTTKKCPFCAEDVKADARLCRFCGRDFTEQSATYAEAALAQRFYETAMYDSALERELMAIHGSADAVAAAKARILASAPRWRRNP